MTSDYVAESAEVSPPFSNVRSRSIFAHLSDWPWLLWIDNAQASTRGSCCYGDKAATNHANYTHLQAVTNTLSVAFNVLIVAHDEEKALDISPFVHRELDNRVDIPWALPFQYPFRLSVWIPNSTVVFKTVLRRECLKSEEVDDCPI